MNCHCVARHNPTNHVLHRHHIWPIGMGGPREAWNKIFICPTTHANTHMLLRMMGRRYDGLAPWAIERRFGREVQRLARMGWHYWDAAGRPVSRENWIWQGAKSAFHLTPEQALARELVVQARFLEKGSHDG